MRAKAIRVWERGRDNRIIRRGEVWNGSGGNETESDENEMEWNVK